MENQVLWSADSVSQSDYSLKAVSASLCNMYLASKSSFEGIIGTEIRMTKLHGQSAIMLEVVRFCHFLKRFCPLYRLRETVILGDMYHVNYFKNCKLNISFQLLLTCFEVPFADDFTRNSLRYIFSLEVFIDLDKFSPMWFGAFHPHLDIHT